jgi:hypothetical protein
VLVQLAPQGVLQLPQLAEVQVLLGEAHCLVAQLLLFGLLHPLLVAVQVQALVHLQLMKLQPPQQPKRLQMSLQESEKCLSCATFARHNKTHYNKYLLQQQQQLCEVRDTDNRRQHTAHLHLACYPSPAVAVASSSS